MVRPTPYSLSFTFKCQSTAVVLVRPLVVAGRILWSRVCTSFHPPICLGVFLELDHEILLNSGMVLETLMKLCMTEPESSKKNCFCSKNNGNGPKIDQKQGVFFNLKKNLVINFHWICSIMKIYIISCVPAQILYCEKSCSWDIGQNIFSQSDCRIYKSTISPEQIGETASFFACRYKFTKLKVDQKIFWLTMVKNGFGQSGLWTLEFDCIWRMNRWH